MPSFDETSHAFLSACFYRLLKEGSDIKQSIG